MADLTPKSLAQQAVRLGLLTEAQVQESWETMDGDDSPDSFLRSCERKGYLTPWQSQKLLKQDEEGFFLGGYRVLYKIASGSFGRVYRAEDPHTGVVVAIKVLRQRWSEEQRTIHLFEREGKVGRSLRHPNIVSILDVNRDQATGQYYIVMEFVEGGNLRDFLAIRKTLQPAEALRLLDDTAAGLAYAYSMGISHRDVKPTNILISAHGTAKLVDFGLAGITTSDEERSSDMKYRTVDYAGLEKATHVKRGDIRSDIYFLGCVLYEMLTGRGPLELSADPKVRMRKQRFDEARTLKPGEISAPPAVFQLLNRMMAFNPMERYQTPSQLLDAIRDVRCELEGEGTTQAPRSVERSVFIVEKSQRLQDTLRDKFKKMGYRVFLSGEATIALCRYRQKPFDALFLDAGGGDEESVDTFEEIMRTAEEQGRDCGGILVLSEDQMDWADKVQPRPGVSVLVRPVNLRQVAETLQAILPLPEGASSEE